jgi:outer membrane lipoprotein-sorting protein
MRARSTIFALLVLLLMLVMSACGREASAEKGAPRTAQSVADSLLKADSIANAQDSTR